MNYNQGKSYKDRKLTNKRPNQFTRNPKQQLFLEYYLNPQSPTFANAYQSAKKAGYPDSYSAQITRKSINKWISENNIASDYKLEHIIQTLQQIASFDRKTDSKSPDDTRIKALELLAKLNGLLIERKQVASIVKVELGRGNERIN